MQRTSWYSELNVEAGDIRLVTLHPDQAGAIVKCSLVQVPLQQVKSYEALSYTWGDPGDTKPIILDGRRFNVTKNLEAALRHLRYEEDDRIIWIDAICINQNDVLERNLQVRRMLKIYSSAERVVVWLGEGTEKSDKAMDFIIRISKSVASPEFPWEDKSLIPSEDECMALAEGILTRPWFQRCWVIQEVVVAQDILVMCGLKTAKWHYLFRSTAQVPLKYSSNAPLVPNTGSIQGRGCCATIDFIRRQHGTSRVLAQLMLRSAAFQSTLAVDRMYSMLGLAIDVRDSVLDPDYSKPVWEVFTVFTKFILQQEKNLNFLCTGLRNNDISNLPSWVPNFTMPISEASNPLWGASDDFDPRRRLFDIFGEFASTVTDLFTQTFDDVDPRRSGQLYNACGTRRMCISFSEDLKFMTASGTLEGTIKSTGPRWEPETNIPARWASYQAILSQWSDLIEDSSCYVNSRYGVDVVHLAFSKTLTADRWFANNAHNDLIRFPPNEGFLSFINPDENAGNWALMLLWSTHYRRRFVISQEGHIGLVPEMARPGDKICILYGCSTPVILRQEEDRYRFIGEW